VSCQYLRVRHLHVTSDGHADNNIQITFLQEIQEIDALQDWIGLLFKVWALEILGVGCGVHGSWKA